MLKHSIDLIKSKLSLISKKMEEKILPVVSGEMKRADDSEDRSDNSKKLKIETNEKVKVNKRKYALLIGYCGEGYFGLQRNGKQRNEDLPTIEDELVNGLVKISAIPQNHADEMFKMSFQRAARTDKGVSAAANLVSLKMELDDNTLEKLNETLPKQIRVFGYNKVTQSFDCKQNCDARTYIYILPTFAFCPIEEILTENFRASDQVIKRVNETLNIFCGTHNFHNCTSGKKYTDPSAKRYIISFECSKPFIKDGHEFAVIKVKGQSFMLHQIRKMIGLVLGVVRGYASEETIKKSWAPHKIDVPTAPALGLMLDQLHYDKYDRKYGKDGVHRPIEWPELADTMETFKHEYIFSNMIRKEIEDKSMFKWLTKLPLSHYSVLDPQFMRGSYNGIGMASHLLGVLNGTQSDKPKEDEETSAD